MRLINLDKKKMAMEPFGHFLLHSYKFAPPHRDHERKTAYFGCIRLKPLEAWLRRWKVEEFPDSAQSDRKASFKNGDTSHTHLIAVNASLQILLIEPLHDHFLRKSHHSRGNTKHKKIRYAHETILTTYLMTFSTRAMDLITLKIRVWTSPPGPSRPLSSSPR